MHPGLTFYTAQSAATSLRAAMESIYTKTALNYLSAAEYAAAA